jgi:phage gp46-like protein
MTINYSLKEITLYDGDPRIFMDDGDGSYLLFKGGQPVMDSGLENAVFISLFTTLDPPESVLGWCGNYLWDEMCTSDPGFWSRQTYR